LLDRMLPAVLEYHRAIEFLLEAGKEHQQQPKRNIR
jgi:hypothetical protein